MKDFWELYQFQTYSIKIRAKPDISVHLCNFYGG